MSIGSSAFSNVTQCWHPSGTLPATAAYWKLSGKCGLVKVEYKYDIWSMVYQEKKKKVKCGYWKNLKKHFTAVITFLIWNVVWYMHGESPENQKRL